jgi:hypothetical protein
LGTGGGNPSSFQNERGGDGEERRRLEDAGVLNSVRSMDALETKE